MMTKRHAFLIFAHNDYPVLSTLLEMLDDRRNDIYLHIDARSTDLCQQVRKISLKESRLTMIPSIRVYWGDVSQVKVEYALYEAAYRNGPYAYYHLLSGVDLPLKPMDEFHRFFAEHEGTEFVEFWNGAGHERDTERKLTRYCIFPHHMRDRGTWVHALAAFLRNLCYVGQRVFRIKRPLEMDFKKGAAWASFTNDFCAALLEQRDMLISRMKYVLCSDEFVIPTIAWQERFRHKVYTPEEGQAPNLREIDWARGINGGPHTWRAEDIDCLMQSKNMFARKFSSSDMEVVKELKARTGKNVSMSK